MDERTISQEARHESAKLASLVRVQHGAPVSKPANISRGAWLKLERKRKNPTWRSDAMVRRHANAGNTSVRKPKECK